MIIAQLVKKFVKLVAKLANVLQTLHPTKFSLCPKKPSNQHQAGTNWWWTQTTIVHNTKVQRCRHIHDVSAGLRQ